MKLQTKIVFALLTTLLSLSFVCNVSFAQHDLINRLGVGMSNQLMNDITSISLKMQKSEQFAAGILFGLSTSDKKGGYGAGIKLNRILFVEPQLNFYSSVLLGLINKKTATTSDTGFQCDGTLGSEFHFSGLQSLGFSFEFGVSVNKINNDFNIQTTGYHFITAAIHFYL
ncbi:MAG: hypothetical protein HQK50_18420 [Oligoflexia bacterium]|nr:hypothetical protein [Oligoflexia bacterium]MBF0367556.1 hypothetical protein [Oligoflexia bacterium]